MHLVILTIVVCQIILLGTIDLKPLSFYPTLMLEGDSFSNNVEATSTISELQEQNNPCSNEIVKRMKVFLAGCYLWIHATQEGMKHINFLVIL